MFPPFFPANVFPPHPLPPDRHVSISEQSPLSPTHFPKVLLSSSSRTPTMPRAEYGMNNSDTESEGDRYLCVEEDEFVPSPPREVRGIPTKCFTCGLPVKIQHPTTGIHAGRKYYVCEAPEAEYEGNHTYRWWDEAMEEEVSDLKEEVRKMKNTLHYITSDDRGGYVDPRMMWARVSLLRDEVDVKLNTCVADMKYLRTGFQQADEDFKKLQSILLKGKNE